jgi:hypothetical protein
MERIKKFAIVNPRIEDGATVYYVLEMADGEIAKEYKLTARELLAVQRVSCQSGFEFAIECGANPWDRSTVYFVSKMQDFKNATEDNGRYEMSDKAAKQTQTWYKSRFVGETLDDYLHDEKIVARTPCSIAKTNEKAKRKPKVAKGKSALLQPRD